MTGKYIAVVLSGLVLLAALIFLGMNIGDTHKCNNLNIYNRTLTDVNIDIIMVLSGVGGAILWIFIKMFARNGWGIYRERRKNKKEEKKTAALVEKAEAKKTSANTEKQTKAAQERPSHNVETREFAEKKTETDTKSAGRIMDPPEKTD